MTTFSAQRKNLGHVCDRRAGRTTRGKNIEFSFNQHSNLANEPTLQTVLSVLLELDLHSALYLFIVEVVNVYT